MLWATTIPTQISISDAVGNRNAHTNVIEKWKHSALKVYVGSGELTGMDVTSE